MKSTNLLLTLALTLIISGLWSCNKVSLKDFKSAREKWDELDDSDYSFVLDIGCFCPQASFSPARVVVHNDSVVALQHVGTFQDLVDPSDSTLVFDKYGEYYPSIDGLFDILEDAIRDADDVDVSYNSEYGYPSELSIDWIRNAVDDEEYYSASGLTL